MKTVATAQAFSDKLNYRGYDPQSVTVSSGKNYRIIADKKIGFGKRVGSFFNVKLLFTSPSSWAERVFLGKKIIYYSGKDFSFIQGQLFGQKLTNLTQLGISALGKIQKPKDPYIEDYDLLEGDSLPDDSKSAEIDVIRDTLREFAQNPHAKADAPQPLVESVDQLDNSSLETFAEFMQELQKAIENPGEYSNKDTNHFFKMEKDGDTYSISLNTRFRDHDDRCLLGRKRVNLEYHQVKDLAERMVKELKPDVAETFLIFATQ